MSNPVIGVVQQPHFEHQEYPKHIYEADGKAYKVVNSKEEEDALKGSKEPIADRMATDSESEANQRAELLTIATEKNIKVDGRWSVDRIRQEIAKSA